MQGGVLIRARRRTCLNYRPPKVPRTGCYQKALRGDRPLLMADFVRLSIAFKFLFCAYHSPEPCQLFVLFW